MNFPINRTLYAIMDGETGEYWKSATGKFCWYSHIGVKNTFNQSKFRPNPSFDEQDRYYIVDVVMKSVYA